VTLDRSSLIGCRMTSAVSQAGRLACVPHEGRPTVSHPHGLQAASAMDRGTGCRRAPPPAAYATARPLVQIFAVRRAAHSLSGRVITAGLPGISTVVLRSGPLGLGGQVAAGGGPQVWVNRSVQGCSQGQSVGRWMTSRRADRVDQLGSDRPRGRLGLVDLPVKSPSALRRASR